MDNDLQQLWIRSESGIRIDINHSKLMESLLRKTQRMDKHVRNRDIREISLSVLMFLVFGWWMIGMPPEFLMAKTGAAIILGGCVLIIIRLLLARKIKKTDGFASGLSQYLQISLEKVRKQIRLLNTVFWWYLLPFYTGVVLIFLSFKASPVFKIIFLGVLTAVYAYIFYINKAAVKKTLVPMENNILKALKELSGDVNPPA
jgi:hypothetical protein